VTENPIPIAVFLSGGGRTLANLIRHRDRKGLPIDIRLVISSSGKVRGVEIAREAGIPTRVVLKSQHPDPQDYRRAMFAPCRDVGAELVVMAGFLKHVRIPPDFLGRVINIHPSLLPAHGGAGMYGKRVHQAVLDSGESETGCTVHWVDDHYDQGPVILQRRCPVRPGDSAETLSQRVFEQECEALPDAIRRIADRREG